MTNMFIRYSRADVHHLRMQLMKLLLLLLVGKVLRCFDMSETEPYYVAQAGLEHMLLQPLCSEY